MDVPFWSNDVCSILRLIDEFRGLVHVYTSCHMLSYVNDNDVRILCNILTGVLDKIDIDVFYRMMEFFCFPLEWYRWIEIINNFNLFRFDTERLKNNEYIKKLIELDRYRRKENPLKMNEIKMELTTLSEIDLDQFQEYLRYRQLNLMKI
jgi:hypothetical protein